MNKNCLVIGDLNVDLVFNGFKYFPELGKEIISRNHFLDIGGSGGIFSAVLSNMGIRTYIISKIGNDFFGNFLINKLENFGVDITQLIIDKNNKTGLTISLSYKNNKYLISSLNLVSSLSQDEIKFREIKNINHVHFTSYYMMNNLKNNYIRIINDIKKVYGDVTFSLDVNDDPENKWGNEIYNLLSNIDIFFLNKKEALQITKELNIKDALNKLSKKVKIAVIKLSNEGCMAKDGSNFYKSKPFQTDFNDSTGAGDNFDAGFIYGFLNNMDIKKSLKIGNLWGSKSVEYLGGVGNKKKFSELRKLTKKLDL